MGTRVAALLDHKGREVVTIDRRATVYDAIALMVAKHVGSVIVTDREQLCGIFTERDYMRRVVLQGRTSKTTQVGEVTDPEMQCVTPHDVLETCMATMTRHRCRHLPVILRGKLHGLISIGDCVARLCDELRAENGHLYAYIGGAHAQGQPVVTNWNGEAQ
jgi:CBS domain-containing protein